MALPTIETPKYSGIIPSNNKRFSYRPFLVKEEKILLIAQETDSPKESINAMKEIIRSCTFDQIDPEDLTTYDLEYIFVLLRSKSVGETSSIKVKCEQCNEYNPIDVNLENVYLNPKESAIDNKVMLTDKIGVNLRHIRVKDINKISDENTSKSDMFINTIISSIENIFDLENVYRCDDTPRDEMVAFISSLNRSQISKIEDFIKGTPKLSLDIEFTCNNENCKCQNKNTLTGANSFFA